MHSKKEASKYTNKKNNTPYQGSFMYYQPKPSPNNQARNEVDYVDEKLPKKRKKLEDSWLTNDELEEDRKYAKIDKLEADLAYESMKNDHLQRKLDQAVHCNKKQKECLLQQQVFIHQLLEEKERLEDKNRRLQNTVLNSEKEKYEFDDKEKFNLIMYDNHDGYDFFKPYDVTKINPEYKKNSNINYNLFKPEKSRNTSSLDIVDMYCT